MSIEDKATKKRTLTPLKAIRRQCLQCVGNSPKEVRMCPATECYLFAFRQGHDPGRKGKGGRRKDPN